MPLFVIPIEAVAKKNKIMSRDPDPGRNWPSVAAAGNGLERVRISVHWPGFSRLAYGLTFQFLIQKTTEINGFP